MALSKRKSGVSKIRKFTFADYSNSSEGERWEIIDGMIFDMTPPPSRIHQKISGELFFLFRSFFQGKTCEVYAAPFGVRLPRDNEADEKIVDVVEPDLVVVCDPRKLDEKGCRGAPDLVVEILSPSTASKDHIRKRELYETHGVKEFWLIDPVNRLITIYRLLPGGKFGPAEILDAEAKIGIPLFPGLVIDFREIFPQEPVVVRESPRKYLAKKGKA